MIRFTQQQDNALYRCAPRYVGQIDIWDTRVSMLGKTHGTARHQAAAIEHGRCLKWQTYLRRKPPPRIPRAAMSYRSARFNHIVGSDLKSVKDRQRGTIQYYADPQTLHLCTALLSVVFQQNQHM